ncbi:MAG: ABC transporter ATP-binding protein [Ktedonobacteraceae bacterium]
MAKGEFRVAHAYPYNQSRPVRWMLSHLLRYKGRVIGFIVATLLANVCTALIPLLVGTAFDTVLEEQVGQPRLVEIALIMLTIVLGRGLFDLTGRFSIESLSQCVARDAREELYISLLGKSQTFHNRQRVGDIMARATSDIDQLSNMIVPGIDTIFDSFSGVVIPLIFIGILSPQLLLAPLFFTVAFLLALRKYLRELEPVADGMREELGLLNADLEETIVGIEVVKSTAQENQEKHKFRSVAERYRDYYVQNGRIQARYLPLLLLDIAIAFGFLHGLFLVTRGQLSVGELVSYIGLLGVLSFPTFISSWSFTLMQLGIAGAERILTLIREETELDENEEGYRAEMKGEIVFEHVSFSYGPNLVLKNISFRAEPGQTVAIVGQTGAGKSTLTKLVNRIYDVDEGTVLIDGVDVRDWNLEALRSQISTIEQDIFLFSKTIAENIAFGLGQRADRSAIEQAAHDAQAHEFITTFKDGYETVLGERGITLSGGQRQRIAIARALLTDPSILILDDSTSAIDSATEDEIQKAIRRLLQGRTTLLITNRLSQIRRADKVLVLKQGELVDQGTHAELLERCELYLRIFVHSDVTLPQPIGFLSKE